MVYCLHSHINESMKNNSRSLQSIINACEELIEVVCGDISQVEVTRVTAWSESATDTISWINKAIEGRQKIAEELLSKVIVCGCDIEYTPEMEVAGKILLKSNHPRLLIIRISTMFVEKTEPYIAPSAIIDDNAVIGSGCQIGNNCVIGKCRIGENTIIKDGTIICDNVQIGNNCILNYSTIVGCACSGMVRDINYKLIAFPHFSSVIIGDNVNIGVRTTVVTGVLTPTIIGCGTNVDSHCVIGHNTVIGEDVYVASDCCISGSVKIGNGVTVFSKSAIAEWVSIGDYSVVGQASLVRSDIPSYEMWFGHPAKFAKKLIDKFLLFE